MPKPLSLAIFATFLVLLGAGCGTTPQQKVDALQKAKSTQVENSGYKECVQKVNDQLAAQEKCTRDALAAKGYTDGLDCIAEYQRPECSSQNPEGFKRYDAQVTANNNCIKELEDPKALVMADCLKLLQ